MFIDYNLSDISIASSQSDLYATIIKLDHNNSLMNKQLMLYASDLHQLNMQRNESDQLLSHSHSDSLARLQKAASYKDEDTGIHVSRIAHLSALIAKTCGMSNEFCKLIFEASPMHDIGKIGIPDIILKKQGRLTDLEWEVMRQHPTYGADILSKSTEPMMKMAREIAQSHHEKWDGSGYPHRLKAEEIPMSARIVAIADFFDAVTMDRCYRPGLPDIVALSMIESERGKHFCPFVTDSFLVISDDIIQLRDAINASSTPP